MGLFKKKEVEMDLPPPPPPEEMAGGKMEFPEIPKDDSHIPSEIPNIKAGDMPPPPPAPSQAMTGAPIPSAPSAPSAEMPGMPAPSMPEPSIPKPAMHGQQVASSEVPYVNIADFHSIMSNVGHIRESLKQADSRILRLGEIKNIEEKELENWRVQLEEIERKLSYIDGVIAKGE